MTRPKSLPGNTLRRNHLLGSFSWSGRTFQVLSYPQVARVTSSKKGVSPSTYREPYFPLRDNRELVFTAADLAAVA